MKEKSSNKSIEKGEDMLRQKQNWKRLQIRVQNIEKILQENICRRLDENKDRIQELKERFTKSIKQNEDHYQEYSIILKRKFERKMDRQKDIMMDQLKELNKIVKEKLGEKKDQMKIFQFQSKISEMREQMDLVKNKLKQVLTNLEEKKTSAKSAPRKKIKRSQEDNEATMVDITTPFAKNFNISGNIITLEKQIRNDKLYQQILLNRPIKRELTFHTHLIRVQWGMQIGIVDRKAQKQKQSSTNSGNAIYYFCSGLIYDGEKERHGGDWVRDGDEISVNVNMETCKVIFVIKNEEGSKIYEVKSHILGESHRQFVPYFEMWKKSASLAWNVE